MTEEINFYSLDIFSDLIKKSFDRLEKLALNEKIKYEPAMLEDLAKCLSVLDCDERWSYSIPLTSF